MKRFVICRASAGSGKTYTLVRQFIEIAISSPSSLNSRFEHILAITFTNKAANEMKERILMQLQQIVTGDPDANDLLNEMSHDLAIEPSETLRRCMVLLPAILHNYSRLSVCTIDSFVHRLVRTFALELHLPVNFNVLIDNNEILQSTVDTLMSLAGSEGQDGLTQVLSAFSESRMNDGKNYKIESIITTLAAELFKEETPAFLDKLSKLDFDAFIDIHRRIIDENRQFESQLSAAAMKTIEVCKSHGLTMDDFPYKKTGIYPYFERLANGDFQNLNKPSKRVDETFRNGILYAKTALESTKQAIIDATPTIVESYDEIQLLLKQGLVDYNSRQMLLVNLYSLALLGKLRTIKDQYYQSNQIVHISEFNKRIAEVVMSEPTPFIYERVGSRYYNYLIDEFQDTSRLQWLNMLPLLDEAMSYMPSQDTAAPGMQSLVVGDGKQAIYRFRQGDVRQFIKLPEVDSVAHGDSLKHNAEFHNLYVNRRTLSNIVEFNNSLFEYIVSSPAFVDNAELHKLYLAPCEISSEKESRPGLYQEPKNKGGYVRVEFAEKEDICAHILAAIRHQVNDLGYEYGDILVLARDNKTLVGISNYLTDNSVDNPIPIVSSESFILSNSRTVLLLLSLLKYLFNTSDRIAAATALQLASEVGCIDTDQHELLWQLGKCDFNLQSVLALHNIEFYPQYLLSLSLYDCCEELLRRFNLHGIDTAYVASFLNVVATFVQHQPHNDLGQFIQFFDEKMDKLSCSTAANPHAVKLMTIHKAKGLEEKIVIVAMPSDRPHRSSLWVNVPQSIEPELPVAYVASQNAPSAFSNMFHEEDLLCDIDRINVLYVALTRPKQKLLLVCEDCAKDDGTDNISLIHSYLKQANVKNDNSVYVIGDDFTKPEEETKKKGSVKGTIKLHDAIFPSWTNRIVIASQSDSLLSTLEASPRRYGILIHELLSQIINEDDVVPVVNNYCRQHRMSQTEADAICERINDMVHRDDIRPLFAKGNKVLCECSMVFKNEIKRPDRMVFMPDRTCIVDFKTGSFNEETHKKYLSQINEYATAVAAMGYPDVRTKIVYL